MRQSRWLTVIIGLALVAACGDDREQSHEGHDHDHAHGHKDHAEAAPHGGEIKIIGAYHLEFVSGRGGAVTLYVLGKDGKAAYPISASSLTIHAKVKGTSKAIEVTLESAPTSDETDGKSSRFMGELPIDLDGKELFLTAKVPIGEETYSAVFKAGGEEEEEEPEHDHDHG